MFRKVVFDGYFVFFTSYVIFFYSRNANCSSPPFVVV